MQPVSSSVLDQSNNAVSIKELHRIVETEYNPSFCHEKSYCSSAPMDGSQTGSNSYEKYLFSSRKCSQVDSAIVSRGDWLRKTENICKVEINGGVVHVVGS